MPVKDPLRKGWLGGLPGPSVHPENLEVLQRKLAESRRIQARIEKLIEDEMKKAEERSRNASQLMNDATSGSQFMHRDAPAFQSQYAQFNRASRKPIRGEETQLQSGNAAPAPGSGGSAIPQFQGQAADLGSQSSTGVNEELPQRKRGEVLSRDINTPTGDYVPGSTPIGTVYVSGYYYSSGPGGKRYEYAANPARVQSFAIGQMRYAIVHPESRGGRHILNPEWDRRFVIEEMYYQPRFRIYHDEIS